MQAVKPVPGTADCKRACVDCLLAEGQDCEGQICSRQDWTL